MNDFAECKLNPNTVKDKIAVSTWKTKKFLNKKMIKKEEIIDYENVDPAIVSESQRTLKFLKNWRTYWRQFLGTDEERSCAGVDEAACRKWCQQSSH